ncbi:MAG: hypothetical protein U0Y82_07575 [Thermoleophilia bacterium]
MSGRGGAGDHRGLAAELRRALARLGGAPHTHAAEPVRPAVHATRPCEARAEGTLMGVPAVPRTPSPPRPRPMGDTAARLHAEPRTTHAVPDIRVRGGDVGSAPPVTHPGPRTAPPAVHAPGMGALTASARTTALCGASPHGGFRPVDAGVVARAEAALPAIRAASARPRADGPLFAARRVRYDWARMRRDRLARAWNRLLDEHRVRGGDVRLVGVYGPVAFNAVSSMNLDADGVLVLRLARAGMRGRAGDVVLARHEVTGALLRTDLV